jgi:UDP-sulfoquinovose synthase
MKVLVIGGDGYLGWPQAMDLSARDHEVGVVDNLSRRAWDLECGTESLIPLCPLNQRIEAWRAVSARHIEAFIGDVTNFDFISDVVQRFKPGAIVHYGEQRSAPYSMIDCRHAVFTQVNNLAGTLNIIYAIKQYRPDCHLVKLGTMGEYGTPNIDIEEGFIEIVHNGRKDVLPYPMQPGSFYHLSKVHDSQNLRFACKAWGLRCTDLNQGIVYGLETEQTALDDRLATRFDYDGIWGTVLNRYCVQAMVGHPLTVYGKGGQTRGYIDIRDTMGCIGLVIDNPPKQGQFRVFNQFTEQFTVAQLAELVQAVARRKGCEVEIESIPDPRVEAEAHYYNAKHSGLLELGLKPHFLSDVLLESLLDRVYEGRSRVKLGNIDPLVNWRNAVNPVGYAPAPSAAKDDSPTPATDLLRAGLRDK